MQGSLHPTCAKCSCSSSLFFLFVPSFLQTKIVHPASCSDAEWYRHNFDEFMPLSPLCANYKNRKRGVAELTVSHSL